MRNVTIKIDEDLARWARMWAAKHDTSVSQLVADMLRQRRAQEEGYQAAMKQWAAWEPRPLREPGEPMPTRDELHER